MQPTRWLAAAAAALTLTLFGTVPARADGPIVLKYPHDVAPTQLKGLAAERIRKLVAERFAGKVEIQVFPNGQLYSNEGHALQALQAGAVQLVNPTFAKWSPLVPELALFDLPYAITSAEMSKELMKRPEIGEKLLKEKLGEKGLLGLVVSPNGFRQMATRRRTIAKLEDLRGLKFRIQASTVYTSFFKAAGASAQALSWSEVYSALSSGVVDGVEAPFDALYGAKLHEVAPRITETDHMFNAYLMATNAKFWNGLPEDIRTGLLQVFNEVADWQWEYMTQLQEESKRKIVAAGGRIHTLDPKEKARMAEHFRAVHDEFKDIVGADTLKALYAVQAKFM